MLWNSHWQPHRKEENVIPSQWLIHFTVFTVTADETSQDELNTKSANISNTGVIIPLNETLPEFYQQSEPLVQINLPLTVLWRHIQHQQEIDSIL